MTVDLLQRAIVHVSLLSCWSRFPGSAPAHMGDNCRIILPVCSYLLLSILAPSSPMTFLHSSPADRGVLSALSFSPPHTTGCSLPPPLKPPRAPHFHPLLTASSFPVPRFRPLDHFAPLSPPLSSSRRLPLCPLQLYILCFLIRPTHWLHLPLPPTLHPTLLPTPSLPPFAYKDTGACMATRRGGHDGETQRERGREEKGTRQG